LEVPFICIHLDASTLGTTASAKGRTWWELEQRGGGRRPEQSGRAAADRAAHGRGEQRELATAAARCGSASQDGGPQDRLQDWRVDGDRGGVQEPGAERPRGGAGKDDVAPAAAVLRGKVAKQRSGENRVEWVGSGRAGWTNRVRDGRGASADLAELE